MTDFEPIVRDANSRLSAKRREAGLSIWSADLGGRQLEVIDLRVVAIDDIPELVKIPFGPDRLLLRDRVYVVDGRRVQWARSYIPMSIAAGSQIELDDTGPGGTAARLAELGWKPTFYAESMIVDCPSADEQAKLGIDERETVCRIDRIALAGDTPVEFTVMTLVASAYRFVTSIVP